jgi:hypothetical protein
MHSAVRELDIMMCYNGLKESVRLASKQDYRQAI